MYFEFEQPDSLQEISSHVQERHVKAGISASVKILYHSFHFVLKKSLQLVISVKQLSCVVSLIEPKPFGKTEFGERPRVSWLIPWHVSQARLEALSVVKRCRS